MDIRQWFRREKKATKVTTSAFLFNSTNNRSYDYHTLAIEGYERNAFVRRGVDLVVNAMKGIPLVVKDEDGTPLPEHDAQRLLDRYGAELTAVVGLHLMLSGNSYLEVVRTASGKPVELYTLRPDLMERKDGYYIFNKKTRFELDEVVHTKLQNPLSDFYGASPVVAAIRALHTHNAANDWAASLLENSAAPSGIITTEGYVSDEDYERLKKEIKENWSGTANAGAMKLLDNGLKFQPISFNPKDMSWLEGKRDAAVEILTALGVPPEMVGFGETTYSNRSEAVKSFYSETIKPTMELYTWQLTNQLVKQFGDDLYVDADYSAIPALREAEEIKLKRLEAMNGILTINEMRALMGYEPVDGGDVILVPSARNGLNEEE